MGTLYEKLKPGPGRSAPEVSSNQRTRIQGAMIELAADRGYGAVTVRGLAQSAGVSTRSFYENFAEKESCFLATYEKAVRTAARRMIGSQRAGRDWRERLRLVLRTATRDIAAEPKAAQLVLVEAFAAGPAALERMRRAEAVFETVVGTSLHQGSGAIAATPFAIRAIVAGTTRAVRARLLAGEVEEVVGLVDDLMAWASSLVGEMSGPAVQRDPEESQWISRLDRAAVEDIGGECVSGDDRTLILAATAKLAAGSGYSALSERRIRAAAGVSRRSFEAHFDGVEDCFLQALEQLCGRALATAVKEGAAAGRWPAGIHRTVAALCARIVQSPVLSQLAFAEVLAAGPSGIRYRERLVGAAAAGLRRGAPPGERPTRAAAEASTGAAWDAIHRCVAVGRAPRLPQQAPTIAQLLLAPASGATSTTRASR